MKELDMPGNLSDETRGAEGAIVSGNAFKHTNSMEKRTY